MRMKRMKLKRFKSLSKVTQDSTKTKNTNINIKKSKRVS